MAGSVVVNVPVGSPQILRPGPVPFSVMGIPAGTGSILLEVSQDNGTTFVQQPLGSVATVNTVGGNGGLNTLVRVTASTANGTAVLSDLSTPTGGAFPSVGGTAAQILLNSVPYTTQVTLTTELELLAIRFPVGVLKPNFRLELDYYITCTQNVNVKTLRAYFGNSANTALEGGTICATQVATSSAGQRSTLAISGRNDGASVDVQSIGVSGGGYGLNTTAPIAITTLAAYAGPAAVEQALVLSYQKATAADSLVLVSSRCTLFQ